MNEVALHGLDHTKMGMIEVNNNLAAKKNRKQSQVSVSSASSYQSDSSEESQATFERKISQEEIIQEAEDRKILSDYKRCRSNSDGAAAKVIHANHFEAFPSLPHSVLEKMGLYGDGPRGRFNEEELEQKFTSLALAFTIDAATIKDRCERQRRYRDQTEVNLSVEIERLKDKLALIQPLCTDFETVDLLSTLLTQVDIIMKAASLVTTSAERFGSVQYEERLTESVLLMINHVQMLKQQRDSARRQLQYTKRVLQNSADSPVSSPTSPHKSSLPSPTRKIIGRRRASIATFSQPLLDNKPSADKKITRRVSDLSLRASSLSRSVRPSRLELSGDLVQINEGFPYETTDIVHHNEDNESENENNVIDNNSNAINTEETELSNKDLLNLSVRDRFKYRFRRMERNMGEAYKRWTDDGTLHEIFCFCALLCFSISLLTMVNILVEYEYAKRGWGTSYFFWSWTDGYSEKKYSVRN